MTEYIYRGGAENSLFTKGRLLKEKNPDVW